jgi:hypothetical protein
MADRLFVSSRCTYTREMLEQARRDETTEFVNDRHKHPFDALTYPIYMECRSELMDEARHRPEASQVGMVSVG